MKKFHAHSEQERDTRAAGERLGRSLRPGDILCLSGDLGAGKTTLVKGIAEGLGLAAKDIHSPTFVILNIHEGRVPLYHFDLYRLEGQEDMGLIGYDEFIYGDGAAVLEWAEHLGGLTPQERLAVEIKHGGGNLREMHFQAHGTRYEQLLTEAFKRS